MYSQLMTIVIAIAFFNLILKLEKYVQSKYKL